LSDKVLYIVVDENTFAKMFLKLEKLFITKFIFNNLLLKKRLSILCMEEGASLKTHLDKLNLVLVECWDINAMGNGEDAILC